MNGKNLGSLVFVSCFLICSCASEEVVGKKRLPFHVAVVPVLVGEKPDVGRDGDVLEIDFGIDDIAMSRAIAKRLEKDCFTRVTLLEHPSNFAAMSPQEKKDWLAEDAPSYWAKQASTLRADLVVESRFGYSTQVRSERNGRFWISLPLFFTLGFLNYFIEDRSYYVSGDLNVRIYDTNLFFGEDPSLTDFKPVKIIEPSIEEIALRYLDRVDSTYLGTYALSVVLPAAFLAKQNEVVQRSLSTRALDELTTDLSSRLLSNEADIDRNAPVVDFYVEPDSVEVRDRDGTVSFAADIVVRREYVEGLLKYAIHTGSVPKERFFEQATRREFDDGLGPRLRYRIQDTVPLGANVTSIQLQVWQNDSVQKTRSYTYPLVWPPQDDDAAEHNVTSEDLSG